MGRKFNLCSVVFFQFLHEQTDRQTDRQTQTWTDAANNNTCITSHIVWHMFTSFLMYLVHKHYTDPTPTTLCKVLEYASRRHQTSDT